MRPRNVLQVGALSCFLLLGAQCGDDVPPRQGDVEQEDGEGEGGAGGQAPTCALCSDHMAYSELPLCAAAEKLWAEVVDCGSVSCQGLCDPDFANFGEDGCATCLLEACPIAVGACLSNHAPAPDACGGAYGACDDDEYCDDRGCGLDVGTCVARPTDCADAGKHPVCGCDGQIYDSACEANAAGFNACYVWGACLLFEPPPCETPSGYFRCGAWKYCQTGTEYCEDYECLSSYEWSRCLPLPESCGADPDCSCLADAKCGPDTDNYGGYCQEPATGEFTVECSSGPDGC